ncbi:Probable RNA-binding protein 18, partial [Linum perenne]
FSLRSDQRGVSGENFPQDENPPAQRFLRGSPVADLLSPASHTGTSLSWGAFCLIVFFRSVLRSCGLRFLSSACLLDSKMDHNGFTDEKAESRVYVGNLDLRITEATLIKMFSPYGTIISEDFLWHTRGPKRGEPRGFAFVQFSSKE